MPKLLYGHNVAQLSQRDIATALNRLSELASDIAKIDFDAARADVAEIEICHNWQLTESEVSARIQSLREGWYPRMTRHCISDSTVTFQNKSAEVSFYAKFAQMAQLPVSQRTDDALKASIGVLRYEHRFFDIPRLTDRLQIPDRSAQSLLTCDFAFQTLEEDMRELGLDRAIENREAQLDLVAERFGLLSAEYEQATKFLMWGHKHGFENLVALGLMTDRTYRRHKKILRDAGALLTTNEQRTFPPLRLVRLSSVMSNTSETRSRMSAA